MNDHSVSEFSQRHIGLTLSDEQQMLQALGFSNLEELASKIIPKNIRLTSAFEVNTPVSEFENLEQLKTIMKKNQVMKSFIGMGFHDCITPSVIQRNVLENPVWYTAYTPYQPEISQGRLESLLNFQTMVADLTGMEISNASLLDEGTAAAEAMAMAAGLSKNKSNLFYVHKDLHPHVIEVLETRAAPIGFELKLFETAEIPNLQPAFCVIVSYPTTYGKVESYQALADKVHSFGGYVIADVDLLAMTLLKPPGEWGADIVVGNSQRFGVPLGFGGPHAAFLATKSEYKRSLPGRLVGVSKDSQNKMALRLTLQTREQHIRREKATSNICTAQVLLANMASMYAVYHGPLGLKKIAQQIHSKTAHLFKILKNFGLQVEDVPFFDTLTVKGLSANEVCTKAEHCGMNFRKISESQIGISLNETTTPYDLKTIVEVLTHKSAETVIGTSLAEQSLIPESFTRTSSFLTHPTFNKYHTETELLRYIHKLQNKDLTLTHSMIPLGSCTMKLNSTTSLMPLSWPEVNRIHPFAPSHQTMGYKELIKDLEQKLCAITGFSGVSLQPNAGSQGEYAGLLVIRKYLESKNQAQRNICLIPSSAHGTNPASAVMAGMEVIVVQCDSQGNVDVEDLKAKAEAHNQNLAALMITYPSTHGVFEERIREICQIIHDRGGQVYMDGANLNALVGLCLPGEFGPDVAHMNLHKTFSIPHGGGGPGVGPIGVAKHLTPFLPNHRFRSDAGPASGIGATTSAPWGSASILTISWSYINMMGSEGLQKASLCAMLSANYIAKKLAPHFPVLYKGNEGLIAHECILDLRPLKKETGVDVTDVAKRLMDYSFHAPTMSFPVAGTLMVEPTESESKSEVDRFIEAMICIRKEIDDIHQGKIKLEESALHHSPFTIEMATSSDWKHPFSRELAVYPAPYLKDKKLWPASARIDNAYGDKNVMCSCPPLDEYTR
jgi:glycine dehydrogenase